jgi:hypothetical protein
MVEFKKMFGVKFGVKFGEGSEKSSEKILELMKANRLITILELRSEKRGNTLTTIASFYLCYTIFH